MPPVHPPKHETAPIRVGLITSSDPPEPYLRAIAQVGALQLTAFAGGRRSDCPDGVEWFDDRRVLLAQAGVNAVLLVVSPRTGQELADEAVAAGVHVWRPPPLATSFAPAADHLRRVLAGHSTYRVSSLVDRGAEALRRTLTHPQGVVPAFSTLRLRTPGPPPASWRVSQKEAGGGVLCTDGYELLELLVAARGLPQSVYCQRAHCHRRQGEPPRETESVALAVVRYGDGELALIEAAWDAEPPVAELLLEGPSGRIQFVPGAARVLSLDGQSLANLAWGGPTWLTEELERFAAGVRSGRGGGELAPSLERHLAVSALLEAAYLSSRTGQPEDPRRLYEVQKWPQPGRSDLLPF